MAARRDTEKFIADAQDHLDSSRVNHTDRLGILSNLAIAAAIREVGTVLDYCNDQNRRNS